MGGTDFGGWDFNPSVGERLRDVDRPTVAVVVDVMVERRDIDGR